MIGYLPVNRGFYNCLIIKGGENMKKFLKNAGKVFGCMLVIALAFVFTLGNADAAPSTITVKRTQTLEDLVNNYKYGFVVFTTTDGTTLYCVDPDKKLLRTNQTATFSKDGDAGLLYILQNGYPNKQITGNDEIDMYITQAAVWWYMDETGQAGKFSDIFKNATSETDSYELVPNYIKPMVAKAKAAKDTQTKPSMKVSNNGTTMKLTSDGKYYESAYMSATLVGTKTYNVEVTGATKNTVVVDEKGNIGTTMNSSERFKVRVPATEVTKKLDIDVKFSASGTIKKAKIYKPSDNTYQRVTGLYDEAVPLTKTVSLNVSPKQRVCEVVGDKYYGKNGTEVDKKTYEKECKNSCEYIDGKYYGKAGNVVDEKTYKEECEPVRSCEFTDDKYYGKDGNEVDKATFDKECGEEVIVPNTSSNVSTLGIVGGMMLLASGAGVIAYRRKQLF